MKKNTPLIARPIVAILPKQTSLLVHSKDFIIKEIMKVAEKLGDVDKKLLKDCLIESTIFPKIGERLNDGQIADSKFDVESVQKYRWNSKVYG